jgi:RNA polymerase sigma-70 factor (ECF subfamily)
MTKYQPEIFTFVFNVVGRYEVTEDLLQEIFLKAFQQLKKYNPNKASFRTWLYRISNNHVLNYVKSKDYKSHNTLMDYEDYYQSDATDIEAELIKDEKIKQVISIMKDTLKPSHQKIFILHYFAGKSVKEIVEILGEKEKTVYYALQSGIEKIKKEVEQ